MVFQQTLVKVDDVVRLEADGNYTTIFMKDKVRF